MISSNNVTTNDEHQPFQASAESNSDDQTGLSPNNPPWGLPSAIVFWIFSVLLISLVPTLFLLPYFGIEALSGRSGKELEAALFADPTAIVVALAGTFGAHLLTLGVGWMLVTRIRTHGFREMLGWEWGGFKIWHGAVIFIGVYAFAIVMTLLLGSQDNEMQRILRSSRAAVFAVAVIATFSAPIVEEVVYRGVLYSAFQRALNVRLAVLAVTLIFASVHIAQYYPDGATILSVLLLSFVLTVLRAKTDNLWPCIFFHFVFNGIQSILLILQPYLPSEVDPNSVQTFLFQ